VGERTTAVARRASLAAGFTLLELVVALFVLGLAVGLALPAVGRSTDSVRARAEVARFAALLRHAREQAITTRQPHAVVLDPAGHRLTLVAGDGEVREARALPAALEVEAVPPPALAVRFEPHGVSTGGEFRLTTGPVRYRITVDPLTGRVRSQRE
jgi:type II secretion system protein H